MKNWQKPRVLGWLTPEKRLEMLAKLLAAAILRLEGERRGGKAMKGRPKIEREGYDLPLISASAIPAKRGRLPFGQRSEPFKRVLDPKETALIERIKELSKEGLSLEKIAQWLNKEDRSSKRAGKWSRTAVWRHFFSISTQFP